MKVVGKEEKKKIKMDKKMYKVIKNGKEIEVKYDTDKDMQNQHKINSILKKDCNCMFSDFIANQNNQDKKN